jgi:hypothetical protein
MHFPSSFSVLENLSSCSNMVNWFLPVRSSVEIGTQAAVSGDYCRLDEFGGSSVRLRTSESFVWPGFQIVSVQYVIRRFFLVVRFGKFCILDGAIYHSHIQKQKTMGQILPVGPTFSQSLMVQWMA